MKKYLSILVLTAMLLALLAPSTTAFGEVAEPASGEVTIWGWADAWVPAYAEYAKINPNISVNYIPMAAEDFVSKFMTSLSAGSDVADITWVELGYRGKLLSVPNAFEQLEDAPYNLNRDDMLDFCVPLAVNADNKIVGIECGPAASGIAYRRDLAKEYFGTDDPTELQKILATWDDYYEKGLEVKEKTGGTVYMFSCFGDIVTMAESAYTEAYVVDNKLNVDEGLYPAFQLAQKFHDAGLTDTLDQWSPAWYASFSSDNYIFYPCASWFPTHVIKPNDPEGAGRWGLMMPPDGAFNWGGTLMTIPQQAKNKAAAWELTSWLNFSKEGAAVVRDTQGQHSAYKPVYDDPSFYDIPDPFFAGQPILKTFAELMFHTKVRPLVPEDSVISEARTLAIQMMSTGSSAEEAIQTLKDEVARKIPTLG